VTGIGTAAIFAGFLVANLGFDCQMTIKVQPDVFWRYGRIAYHLILITLLIAATATDFRDYVIPDQITLPGMVIGVAAATFSGDLQTMHLWIDWNYEEIGLQSAYVPAWLDNHRHLHGLAWSIAGLVVGGGLTWIVRWVSSLILGQEALGFGDVTLMAMIGSFIGWQPVIFVFLLAPFCGVMVAIIAKLVTNRPIIPYGPYLCAAAIGVMFSWRWLWEWEPNSQVSIRRLFGDWIGLLILAGTAIAALAVLLGFLRIYRMIPGRRRDTIDD
jgi:leader peptidase (prepilin peptidase)/N-methyltransferase